MSYMKRFMTFDRWRLTQTFVCKYICSNIVYVLIEHVSSLLGVCAIKHVLKNKQLFTWLNTFCSTFAVNRPQGFRRHFA